MNYDLYVLSDLRDKETINHFIDHYSERSLIEDRKDEELMVLPLGIMNEDTMNLNKFDWISAIHINNVIDIGTRKPVRAFRFYLDSGIHEFSGISITFTLDNKIIYVLSMRIENEKETLKRAEERLKELHEEYQGIKGGIFFEEPPFLNGMEFIKVLETQENHCLRLI